MLRETTWRLPPHKHSRLLQTLKWVSESSDNHHSRIIQSSSSYSSARFSHIPFSFSPPSSESMTMGGASSLCDSLVAACISSATQFDTTRSSSRWPHRKRLLSKCSLHGPQPLFMSSRDNNASSSLFESNHTFLNPKQRRFNPASASGIYQIPPIFYLFSYCLD